MDIVLIDKGDAFVFGFSKLDVMFGRQTAAAVRHPYRDIAKPGVRFLQSTVRLIDPKEESIWRRYISSVAVTPVLIAIFRPGVQAWKRSCNSALSTGPRNTT